MIDNKGALLTPQQIFAMSETETGRRQVAEYIWRARTAMSAQRVMETLGIVPDAKTQQMICEVIWDTIFRVDIFKIMDYCREIAKAAEASDIDCVGRA